MRKIVVIGAGYVGLVTAAGLAKNGNFVTVVERDTTKIDQLLKNCIPFYEPGLQEIVQESIQSNYLTFTQDIAQALFSSPEFIFSCVDTPSQPDGSADLTAVVTVANQIAEYLIADSILVNKSTAPVGTSAKIEQILRQKLSLRNTKLTVNVVSNPEFLQEGSAVNNFFSPDRVVVGTDSKSVIDALFDLYKPFLKNKAQFISMDRESAELTKYAANAMLALRISFMNQLALFAEVVNANIDDIKKGISKDKRIGKSFLNAGIGYGGSCFSKDIQALTFLGKKLGQPLPLIEEIETTNKNQKIKFIQKISNFYGNNLEGKKIGIWGLSFKPKSDDIRSAPALDIIKGLLAKKAIIIAYDPMAMPTVKKIFENKITFTTTSLEILHQADCLLILTEWKEFLKYHPSKFLLLKDKTVFDGRNCFTPDTMGSKNINYFSIGRRSINQSNQHYLYAKLPKKPMQQIL